MTSLSKTYLFQHPAGVASTSFGLREADGTTVVSSTNTGNTPGATALQAGDLVVWNPQVKSGLGADTIGYFFDAGSQTHNWVCSYNSVVSTRVPGELYGGTWHPGVLLSSGNEIVLPKTAVANFLQGLSLVTLA